MSSPTSVSSLQKLFALALFSDYPHSVHSDRRLVRPCSSSLQLRLKTTGSSDKNRVFGASRDTMGSRIASNSTGTTPRTTRLPGTSSTTLGGIVGALVFRPEDAPNYRLGLCASSHHSSSSWSDHYHRDLLPFPECGGETTWRAIMRRNARFFLYTL